MLAQRDALAQLTVLAGAEFRIVLDTSPDKLFAPLRLSASRRDGGDSAQDSASKKGDQRVDITLRASKAPGTMFLDIDYSTVLMQLYDSRGTALPVPEDAWKEHHEVVSINVVPPGSMLAPTHDPARQPFRSWQTRCWFVLQDWGARWETHFSVWRGGTTTLMGTWTVRFDETTIEYDPMVGGFRRFFSPPSRHFPSVVHPHCEPSSIPVAMQTFNDPVDAYWDAPIDIELKLVQRREEGCKRPLARYEWAMPPVASPSAPRE
ncbi:MAG: hypothetical protein SGJ09_13655 [Phycisphaerae bacterium]|nr:hypothetical protein [Phycisphaerae bacterium]